MTLRIRIGESLMAGTDDPLFLGLRGADGREFRVRFARGHSLRRGAEDVYGLGPPDDADTNIANPAFNDPSNPAIDAAGMGEMDDRLEVLEVELSVHAAGRPKPLRFLRRGPIWLGLVSGLRLDLPRVEEGE
jgi:hypothetical protein